MRSFVSEYFDGKDLEGLQKVITPDWSEQNINHHLSILDPPLNARRILEIGCGLCRLLIPLYDRGTEFCVGVDASQSMITEARKIVGDRDIDLFLCDGSGKIDLRENDFFDFIFSIITFQHIPDIETVKRYLAEACRLLSSSGFLTFQVLSSDIKPGRELWTYHDLGELKKWLVALGFKVKMTGGPIWTVFRAIKKGLDKTPIKTKKKKIFQGRRKIA